ncbi:MAG: hypothetical protein AB1515_00695 [Nitrospirota bacterium]
MEEKIKEGGLYRERDAKVKFPRIIKVRKIEPMGPLKYVFFMAQNQAAQAIHPNGGFVPVDSFLAMWEPVSEADAKYSGRNGPA